MPQFDNAYYQQLPGFYTALHPTPLKDARLLYHSEPLARELGLDESWFTPDKTPFGREKRCCPACSRWHRCTVATSLAYGPGSWGWPRHFTGRTGPADGSHRDWHLKGAGLTPYSRMGTAARCCAR